MYSYRIVVHTHIQTSVLFVYLYFFRNEYLKQPSIDFDFWNLTSLGDVVAGNDDDINTSFFQAYHLGHHKNSLYLSNMRNFETWARLKPLFEVK
jgi:hypothetical protein